MTQDDIDRRERIAKIPAALDQAAVALSRRSAKLSKATAAREAEDQRHVEFVAPTAMQRVGYAMRLGLYPASYLAELTAGAASSTYLARTLLKVPEQYLWLAPWVFAAIVLLTEIWVAHSRESGRNALDVAPIGWSLAAAVVLVTLVGLQVTSQLADAIKPVAPGDPIRPLGDLPWYAWARVVFLTSLISVIHAGVLFAGRAQERALAYAIFRIGRRLATVWLAWYRRQERRAMAVFSRLVTVYHAERSAHSERGFNPGPTPAFTPLTRAMLERLRGDDAAPSSTAADQNRAAPSAQDRSNGAGLAGVETTTATPPARPIDAPDAPGIDPVADENAYLRSILDARTRDADGEVRAPAR